MGATDKFLAARNKSRVRGPATKSRSGKFFESDESDVILLLGA